MGNFLRRVGMNNSSGGTEGLSGTLTAAGGALRLRTSMDMCLMFIRLRAGRVCVLVSAVEGPPVRSFPHQPTAAVTAEVG